MRKILLLIFVYFFFGYTVYSISYTESEVKLERIKAQIELLREKNIDNGESLDLKLQELSTIQDIKNEEIISYILELNNQYKELIGLYSDIVKMINTDNELGIQALDRESIYLQYILEKEKKLDFFNNLLKSLLITIIFSILVFLILSRFDKIIYKWKNIAEIWKIFWAGIFFTSIITLVQIIVSLLY